MGLTQFGEDTIDELVYVLKFDSPSRCRSADGYRTRTPSICCERRRSTQDAMSFIGLSRCKANEGNIPREGGGARSQMKEPSMKEIRGGRVYRLLEAGPIVLVTTAGRGRANATTMGFHMMIQHDPPLIGCVIGPWDHGFAALCETRECVISIPGADLASKVVDIGNCTSPPFRHERWARRRSRNASRTSNARLPMTHWSTATVSSSSG